VEAIGLFRGAASVSVGLPHGDLDPKKLTPILSVPGTKGAKTKKPSGWSSGLNRNAISVAIRP
jgi:hypothetical protein